MFAHPVHQFYISRHQVSLFPLQIQYISTHIKHISTFSVYGLSADFYYQTILLAFLHIFFVKAQFRSYFQKLVNTKRSNLFGKYILWTLAVVGFNLVHYLFAHVCVRTHSCMRMTGGWAEPPTSTATGSPNPR